MKRALPALTITAGLVMSVASATPAVADAAAYSDPIGDSSGARGDVVSHFLALNSTAVVSTITYRVFDAAYLQNADISAELDTNDDSVADFTLDKPGGGQTARVLQGDLFGVPLPGCAADAVFDAGRRTVSLSTSAACIGRPDAVSVAIYSFGSDSFDAAPDVDPFTSPPVRTDAPAVIGAIGERYRALGGQAGVLGRALTNEGEAGFGGRFVDFQRGAIYWSETTGAHEVYGAIQGAFNAAGKEYSGLGLPLTGEFGPGNERHSDFQGGFIVWTPSRGATVTLTR